jgi:beta-lactamase class A
MKWYNVIILSVILFSCTQSKKAMQTINRQIEEKFAGQKGVYAMAYKDLQTGEAWGINDHMVYHAASTMKTAVMYEVYRQVAAGNFLLSDSVVLQNEFKSIADGSSFSLDAEDDSEKELYQHLGEKRTISFLVYQMIIVSSNLATNLVIEKVGATRVTATLRELGIMNMQVLRGVEDGPAFAKGMNNTITARDQALLFECLDAGRLISADATQSMMNILLDQRFNEIIPARLPIGVRVAHKTGSITGVQHDAGIVILPDGRKYILVLLSRNIEDEKAAINMMAEVSEMVYQYFVR